MKAVTIKYDPITGAQMTVEDIFPTETPDVSQEQKARRASHEATELKSKINQKRTHSIQHKQK